MADSQRHNDTGAGGASEVFAQVVQLQQDRRGCVLCTVLRTAGSTPRKMAARMVVSDDRVVGTIGGGKVEHEVIDAARALLAKGEQASPQILRYHLTRSLGMCCGGEMEVFVDPLLPAPWLLICGGGHIGQALLRLCQPLGFVPVLIEDLDELRVAGAGAASGPVQVLDSFEVEDWEGIALDGRCYVVVVTRDHALDQRLVEQLLPHALGFLGVIGSQRKSLLFRERLRAKGFSEAQIARLHSPVGLDIGAQTPAEIAVSILAELVQVRARRQGLESSGQAMTTTLPEER
jgi:xanthine dehydrogenase accessory factor